jgi:hypothetical protein
MVLVSGIHLESVLMMGVLFMYDFCESV